MQIELPMSARCRDPQRRQAASLALAAAILDFYNLHYASIDSEPANGNCHSKSCFYIFSINFVFTLR